MDDPHPSQKNRIAFSLAATVLFGGLIFWIHPHLQNDVAPWGFVSFELAKNPFRAELILNSWGREGQFWATWSLILDFPFLVAYTVLLCALSRGADSDLKHLFTVCFLIAGMCDAVENVALGFVLGGGLYPQLTAAAYYFASLKFLLLITGIGFLLTRLMHFLRIRITREAAAKSN
ncbi:hypothetical protein O5O45_28515 [Hahella aquimaris]|uniref:hypothetical protein n=1 Tax=Hahella sp. HNIBRBA332 TaxID=3015983 RepID=UPI00273BF59B|nr:hypothetical protein [Hahella sp. HNIBRBA332]WLQ13676.1 hypothetical protein O5O45_28515 [Hahella sp. HNIBRBA332]